MHVVVPASLCVRMCFDCPHCNVCHNDPNLRANPQGCSDLRGCNHKLMGGFAGIATAHAFVNEHQGEGTPHGHGFVALANIYAHCSLQEIATMLTHNATSVSGNDLLERIKAFCSHVQRESHCDLAQHEADLARLEHGFKKVIFF